MVSFSSASSNLIVRDFDSTACLIDIGEMEILTALELVSLDRDHTFTWIIWISRFRYVQDLPEFAQALPRWCFWSNFHLFWVKSVTLPTCYEVWTTFLHEIALRGTSWTHHFWILSDRGLLAAKRILECTYLTIITVRSVRYWTPIKTWNLDKQCLDCTGQLMSRLYSYFSSNLEIIMQLCHIVAIMGFDGKLMEIDWVILTVAGNSSIRVSRLECSGGRAQSKWESVILTFLTTIHRVFVAPYWVCFRYKIFLNDFMAKTEVFYQATKKPFIHEI